MKRALIVMSIVLLAGGLYYLVQWPNYNVAMEHSAADQAGILYTVLVTDTDNWCLSSPKVAERILRRNPLQEGMKDPWGKDMKINCSKSGFENVCSLGRDGVEKTDDDICVDFAGVKKGKKVLDWEMRDWRSIISQREDGF